jgi:hypothetical protein
MKYVKPKKGNRHGLTVHQHTFPRRSLNRFTNAIGVLSVRRNRASNVFKLKPDHKMFCARRAWDQRAERGYMKSIEDEFQDLAERVLGGVAEPGGGSAQCSDAILRHVASANGAEVCASGRRIG